VGQQFWQDLFGVLVLGAGVLSGLGLWSSAAHARAQPRGQKHRNTPSETVLISFGVLLMATAFLVAATKAFV
jgi:hypothetical protein